MGSLELNYIVLKLNYIVLKLNYIVICILFLTILSRSPYGNVVVIRVIEEAIMVGTRGFEPLTT